MKETENQTKWTKDRILDEFFSWIKYVIIPFLLVFFLLSIFKTTVVSGSSMMDNYHDGDWLIMNRLAYVLDDPSYKDVIVFKAEDYNNMILIKRVIAVEGDTVEIKDGNVYVNDEKLDEPYINQITPGNVPKTTVPKDSVFVLGDNRGNSVDSRFSQVGFVPESAIMGKAVIRVYPFNQIGLAP